jgi:hypothetical protein
VVRKSAARRGLWVQIPPLALAKLQMYFYLLDINLITFMNKKLTARELFSNNKFKYSDDDSLIINFLLVMGGIEAVIEEYGAKIVDFPLDPIFKRVGNYFIQGNTYYVMEDGLCLCLRHGFISSTEYDFHWLSEKEMSAISNVVLLFGYTSIKPSLLVRYKWQKHMVDLFQISLRAKLMRIRINK